MNADIPQRDLDTLRALATRKAEIAHHPRNAERRRAWYDLDAGVDARPMVLAEIWGVRDHNPPVADAALACSDPWARTLEKSLRGEIYRFEELDDDYVLEPWIQTGWQVQVSDYGVAPVQHQPEDAERLGARRWDPPLRDLERDLKLLRPRTFHVDREATHRERQRLEAVFSSVLPVRLRGGYWWTMGMTWPAIELMGLEQLMLAMFDAPAALHSLMAFLRDEHLRYAQWLEDEGVLCLNNENDYIGSGSLGYTRDLPRGQRRTQDNPRQEDDRQADHGCRPGHRTRPCPHQARQVDQAQATASRERVRQQDQWVLLESQETVGVGPEQFAEFVFPYQQAVARRFGKVYYGCCEPVHTRLHIIQQLDNLARVSVSPWADEAHMAAALGDRVVYSRKPNPTLISVPVFDEEAIRADLRNTLETARGCRLEIIMKDVHTLVEEPDRLCRWVALARREIDRLYG